MNLTRCSKGHFYDADTNASCPHCQQDAGDSATVAVIRNQEDDTVTKPLTGFGPTSLGNTNATSNISIDDNKEDDAKTISYPKAKLGLEPVVGWLVCTEGAHLGEDFRLKTGKNFIGRSSDMDAALTKDKSVSRDKHAIVVYEPKTHLFLVQPGEARELCYLNDQVVLSAQELKANDVIAVGDSKLMFFPCCNDKFNWSMVEKNED